MAASRADGATRVPAKSRRDAPTATERLRDGELLPSVRELARRLKVHHNTVSEAYQDLVQRKWLERRRGSRLALVGRPCSMNCGGGSTW